MLSALRSVWASLEIKARQRFSSLPWIVAVVLVGLGCAYSSYLADSIRFYDETDYWQLADNLGLYGMLTYDGVSKTAFRPPLYPVYLFALSWAGGGQVALRISQFLLLSGSVILLSAIVRRFHGHVAGSAAAVMTLLYPALFYTAGTFFPQTLAAFLFLAGLYLLAGREPLRASSAVLAGSAFSLLLLTVPTFAPSIAIVLVFKIRDIERGRRIILTYCLAPLVLLLGAWTVRNWNAFDSIFFVSTNSGLNLYIGNNELTTPTSGVAIRVPDLQGGGTALNEAQRDEGYRRLAWQWMTENPGRCANLYLGKLLSYFSVDDRLATKSQESSLHTFVMAITYLPLLVLVAARLMRARRNPLSSMEALFLCLYLVNGLTSAVFFCRIRFRLPYDLLLIGVAAAFIGARLAKERGPSAH